MRSVRVSSSFLICSLGAWKIFQGVQPMDYMEMEDDLAHLDSQDRVGSNLMKDQNEGWRAGKRSRDDMMITEVASSSTPSVNYHRQNSDMTGVSNITKIRKNEIETEISGLYREASEYLELWISAVTQSKLTEDEKATFIEGSKRVREATRNLYITDEEHSKKLGGTEVTTCLHSIFQIMESLHTEEEKIDREIVERGYHLMNTILIDMMQLEILSKDCLSFFLNEHKNAISISSHALKRLDTDAASKYPDYNKIGPKIFIQDSRLNQMKEAKLLRLLNQDTWLNVEFDCMVGILMPLNQPKEVKKVQFGQLVHRFLEREYNGNMKISQDQINSFTEILENNLLNIYNKQDLGKTEEEQKRIKEKNAKDFKIIFWNVIISFSSGNNHQDQELVDSLREEIKSLRFDKAEK